MIDIAKILIMMGALLVMVGIGFYFFDKIPGVGKLPGDIFIKKENFTFYFPITTSIFISIILSLILYLLSRR